MSLNDAKINELLQRLVEDIKPSREEFFKVINSKKLTIYHGADPTSPHLHLGHSTNYLLMSAFHQMGHEIVLLIGDFTARIGDPSGRTSERVPLTKEQVEENYKTYKDQAARILNFESKDNPIEVKYNSEWLGRLNFEDVIKIASHFTVQQMIAREMFQKRLKEGNPIGLHEFFYPLMQGYDSVALNTDAEIGGNDQLFNMMTGRDLVKDYLNKEKFVITTKLLINPKTGKKLMSKSEGNYIALNDSSKDMYGKVMALPDEVVVDCFNLCTEIPNKEIAEIMKVPEKDRKARLAYEVVKMYHGEDLAKEAGEEFKNVFVAGRKPSGIEVRTVSKIEISIVDAMVESGVAASKGEARRLIEQGGVYIYRGEYADKPERIENPGEVIEVGDNTVLRVGQRRFVRLVGATPNSKRLKPKT